MFNLPVYKSRIIVFTILAAFFLSSIGAGSGGNSFAAEEPALEDTGTVSDMPEEDEDGGSGGTNAPKDNEAGDPGGILRTMNALDGEGSGIAFVDWYLENEGVVTQEDQNYYIIGVYFSSQDEISTVDFVYSQDGLEWMGLEPFYLEEPYGPVLEDEDNGVWYKEICCDLEELPEGTYSLKATAAVSSGESFSAVGQFIKRTAAEAVRNFTVNPNEENNALVLAWDSPTDSENIDYIHIYKWQAGGGWYMASDTVGNGSEDGAEKSETVVNAQSSIFDDEWYESPDGSDGYWDYINEAEGSSYTDFYVRPYSTYYYRVVTGDSYGNSAYIQSSGALEEKPLYYIDWYMNDSINLDNVEYFYTEVAFAAAGVINAIDYYWSEDGEAWHSFDDAEYVHMIINNGELRYNDWDDTFSRYLELNLQRLSDGQLWFKSIATDEDGNTLEAVKAALKDTVSPNATDLTVVPNAANNALVLTWSNPEDFSYVRIYKYMYGYNGWKWYYIDDVEGNTYTDEDVEAYTVYSYKIIVIDTSGNESGAPPVVEGHLDTEGPIAVKEFSLENEGKISSKNHSYYYYNASFNSIKEITSIDYTYSADGQEWNSMVPFLAQDDGLRTQRDGSTLSYYRFTRIAVNGPFGWPDGTYTIKATATDSDGNSFHKDATVIKDCTPPMDAVSLTAAPNGDNTAIVLNWENPVSEDFDHVSIKRDGYWHAYDIKSNTYTDTTAKVGVSYQYQAIAIDAFGNEAAGSEIIPAILPAPGPILMEMYPADDSITNESTVGYSMRLRDDQPVVSVLFEVSNDGGVTWVPLNAANTSPNVHSSNEYYLSRSWNVSTIGEESFLIRAMAIDELGRTITEVRTVTIDHAPPPVPSNFSAAPGTASITLSWDPIVNTAQYELVREFQNPEEGYSNSYYIYPPAANYIDDNTYYIKVNTPYLYKLRARDTAGNWGPYATVSAEIVSGPALSLAGGLDIYTNQEAYTLRGIADEAAEVTINGAAVAVGSDGDFEYTAVLSAGRNYFEVIASKDNEERRQNQRVTLDTGLPSGSISSPYDGVVISGKAVYIEASSSDNYSLARAVLQISREEGIWIDLYEFPTYGSTYKTYYWDTTAPLGDYGPLADGGYKLRLWTQDRAGNDNSGTAPVRVITLDNTPPQTPRDLAATAGADQSAVDRVSLSWTQNLDYDDLHTNGGYSVYRSTTQGEGYVQVGTSSSNSYVDKTAVGGTTYYYVITARDKRNNYSAYSNEASAASLADTTNPVLGNIPVQDNGTVGGDSVRLYLTATDNSPRGVKQFKYAYSQDGGVSWQEFSAGASFYSSYYYREFYWNTNGLTEGEYQLKFSAIDHAGNTAAVTRTVNLDKSVNAPGNLKARRGEGSIILEWDASDEQDILYYDILRSTYMTGGYYEIKTNLYKDTLSYNDTSVSLDRTYYYKVRIRDIYGNAAESAVVWAMAADDMTPPDMTRIDPGDEQERGGPSIGFWAYGKDNKAVTQMSAWYSVDGGVSWTAMVLSSKDGPRYDDINKQYYTYFVWNTAGLTTGSYKIKVTGRDAAGNEDDVQATWHLDLDVSAIANLQAIPGDGFIKLTWDPLTSEELYYQPYTILRATDPAGAYMNMGTGSLEGSYTDNGLQPGITYYYRVKSMDKYANATLSEVVSARTLADTVPPYITGYSPDNGDIIGGNTAYTMTVFFSDNAGTETARLEAEISGDGGLAWTPLPYEIAGPIQSDDQPAFFWWRWDLSGMKSGIYDIRYTLYDAEDNYYRNTVFYEVDRIPPSAPGNLTASYGSGSIGLAWDPPTNAQISYYRIYRANSLYGPYVLIDTLPGINGEGQANRLYNDGTVASGLTYYYKVRADDNFGQESEFSNIAAAAALIDNIPPTVLGIMPESFMLFGPMAEITVRAEDNLALSAITLYYSVDNGESWEEADTIATNEWADFKWNTAAAGVHGTVLVRPLARDSAGNYSDGSEIRSYEIDTIGPSKIQGLEVSDVYPTTVVLQWQKAPEKDTHYYQVEGKEASAGEFTSMGKTYYGLYMAVEKLQPEKDYLFRVVAYDKFGNRGSVSEEVTAYTTNDNISPQVIFLTPPASIKEKIGLRAIAEDNAGVVSISFRYSTDNKETWNDLNTAVVGGKRSEEAVYEFDVTGLPEGSIFVKVTSQDAAGNISGGYICQYLADRTPPLAPAGLSATPSSGHVDLAWSKNSGEDEYSYEIHRAFAEEGPFTREGMAGVSVSTYRDRFTGHVTAWYKICAVDAAGNKGDFSEVVSASLIPDNTAPVVYSMAPYSGRHLGKSPEIRVLSADDYLLATVALEYRKTGSSSEWTNIGTKNLQSLETYYHITSFIWNTTDLEDGTYEVRGTAVDAANNVSLPMTVTYEMHLTPPVAPILTAIPGGWKADLEWTGGDETDFKTFRVYRSTISGGPYKLLKTTVQCSYTDLEVTPGQYYYYLIEAEDNYFNISQSMEKQVLPTSEDLIPPVAVAGDDRTAVEEMEIGFDGTLSRDNDRVVRYEWDFGDGTISSSAKPYHAYPQKGIYPVSLTVYDPAGNSNTGYLTVTVMSPQKVGNMEVRVLDDISGAPIAGASVVVEFPDGSSQKSVTDISGITHVIAGGGEYKVYAYKKDYMPVAIDAVLVENQKSTSTVRLKKGELVVGDMTVERMTLDEIIAAGIDVNAPENQYVYKYTAQLVFNEVVHEIEDIIFGDGGGSSGGGGGGGGGSFYLPDISGSGGVEVYPVVLEMENHPEVPPTIAFLAVPAEARWLKEFFEVSLTLQNTAGIPFNLAGCMAELKLPEGLSLAPTQEPQNLQMDLGLIAGGESRQAKWIIRGDESGHYSLEAEFNGILEPFGDTVRKLFRTKEPFRVWGGDALTLTLKVQERLDRGHPYNMRYELKNVADVPVYNLTHEMKEEGKLGYIYAPNQTLSRTVRELLPGEALILDYQLISAEGVAEPDPLHCMEFDPNASSIVKTGGNAELKWNIVTMTVSENIPGIAPVLHQENVDGVAKLTWDPLEGVEGLEEYRLYRIREDLAMSRVPEMIAEFGPEVTEYTVPEPNGPRDYILTSLINGREITRHAITGFGWADSIEPNVLVLSHEEIPSGKETELIITAYRNRLPLADGTVDITDSTGSVIYVKDLVLDENGQARFEITPAAPGDITVKIYDTSHNFVMSSIVVAVFDSSVATPTGLGAVPGDGQARLYWNSNSETDLAGYNIYRLIDGKWTKINAETVTANEYTVLNLDYGIGYAFCITALTDIGLESLRTRPISVTLGVPTDEFPPAVVATLPAGNARNVSVDSDISIVFNKNLLEGAEYKNITLKANGINMGYTAALAGDTVTLTPVNSLPYSTQCEITIPADAVEDYGANSLAKDFILRFMTTAPIEPVSPAIVATSPAAESKEVLPDVSIYAIFNKAIIQGEAFREITLTANGVIIPMIAVINDNSLRIKPLQELPEQSLCRVEVPARAVLDVNGNYMQESFEFYFITRESPDIVSPQVIASNPSGYTSEVSQTPAIRIVFDEELQEELFGIPTLLCGASTVPSHSEVIGRVIILTPEVPLDKGKNYTAVIPAGTVKDLAGNSLAASFSLTFTTIVEEDSAAPVVFSTIPAHNEEGVPVNTGFRIVFNEQVQMGVNFKDIILSAGGISPTYTAELQEDALVLVPAAALPFGSECRIILPAGSVKDMSGNSMASEFSFRFVTEAAPDISAPVVTASSPAANSSDVSRHSVINIIFNESVSKGAGFTNILVKANGVSVEYTAEISSNTLTLALSEDYNLPYSAECQVNIPEKAVQDMSGNESDFYTMRFTTLKTPDTIAPTVLSTRPGTGLQNVSAEEGIEVFFSEEVKAGEKAEDIVVKAGDGIGTEIAARISFINGVLNITPEGGLPLDTKCTVIIPSGAVCDMAGNGLEEDYIFSFTTAKAPDTTPPVMLLSRPSSAAVNVKVDSVITILFNENVKPGEAFHNISMKTGNKQATCAIAYEGGILTLIPEVKLDYGKTYSLEVPAGAVCDQAGNMLAEGLTVTFTTEAAPISGGSGGGNGGGSGDGNNGGGSGNGGGGIIIELSPEIPDIPKSPAVITPDTGIAYSDVQPGHWAVREIITLSEMRIIGGYPDGTFKPDNSITRGEVAAIVARALELQQDRENIGGFLDVPDLHWALGYILAVNARGIMQGDGKGYFRPDALITREELAKVIMAIIDSENASETSLTVLERFKDKDGIAAWARSYIARGVQLEIINGVTTELFSPKAFATRAQVAALIYRVLKLSDKLS